MQYLVVTFMLDKATIKMIEEKAQVFGKQEEPFLEILVDAMTQHTFFGSIPRSVKLVRKGI